jgi:lipid II:glycine glycyltransferase (peptidoglycan interpeptide bridge formation enzyme)
MSNFAYEIFPLSDDSQDWNSVFEKFVDSNIYQTEAFTKYSQGGDSAERFILKKDDEIKCAALVRIKVIPKLSRGLAYIRWGPMCNVSKLSSDLSALNSALRFLYEEYVLKRKLVLRIFSGLYVQEESPFHELFTINNFKPNCVSSKTIILDITKDECELRNSFRKKWRYTLKQAEKNNIDIINGSSDEYYNIFKDIYSQMHIRKKFTENVDINVFQSINQELEKNNKMNTFIAYSESKPIAAVVVSAIGERGIYLLGGSTEEGLKLNASYLLQWRVIKWLKSENITLYDLGGIDKKNNPGVYRFKSGMGGTEVNYLGSYEACKDLISMKIVKLGEMILPNN